MIVKDNYIVIMCKKISAEIIKKIARSKHKVGIYYRNGFVLDTVNGVISKINKNKNLSYELFLYPVQEHLLKGLKDYDTFYEFIRMYEYFKKYYEITLYWDETKNKCVYEKTTPLDKFGGWSSDTAFKPIRQINVNSKIFLKIKLQPDLEETLNGFVDKTIVSDYYKD